MKNTRAMMTRLIGFILILLGALAILLPAFAANRLDSEVKSLLLDVQTSLQKFHVEEELYPKSKMSGSALISLLIKTGHLEAAPGNPWTGEVYTLPEDETDFLEYETDELAETYTLIARKKNSDVVHHILDSTEHHSLE